MTRARDELILTHAADYGGARARRISPFVLEALDLPIADAAGERRAARRRQERLAAFAVAERPVAPPRGPITEPLSLSFYQVDDYLTCPRKYQYGHVLRVPLAPHHALVYGAALHKVVQLFHQRHARGHVMTEAELDEVLDGAWSNEGFVSREHEEARLAAGRAALRRFREAQLPPDAVIPTYVEREFSFMLGGDRVRGRWDRVDVEPSDGRGRWRSSRWRGRSREPSADVVNPTLGILGPERVTITDYKSSDVRDPVKAQRACPRLAPAPDLRDGLRGDDRPAAGRPGPPLPRLGPGRQRARWIRGGWTRPASGSGRRRPGSAPGTTRRRRPERPARGARSGTSARRAWRRRPRRDRASARVDSRRRASHAARPRGPGSSRRHRRSNVTPMGEGVVLRLERLVRPWALTAPTS